MGITGNEKKQENYKETSESSTHHQKAGLKNSSIQRAQSAKRNNYHSKHKFTVDDWARRLEKHLNSLSQVHRETVFGYLEPIRSGINKATKDDGLDEFEHFESVKESFEYNLLIKATPYILCKRPLNKSVEKWAKKLTMRRKYSWKDWLISQRESIQINAKSYRLVFNEIGDLTDFGLPDSEWIPPINSPNPFVTSPEDCLIELEKTYLIQKLFAIIGDLDRKRAQEFLRIFLTQMNGFDITSKFGEKLAIPENDVANFKIQMIEAVRKFLIAIDPDLEKKITLYKLSKGKTWKIQRSTREERRALYRDPYAGQKIACILRVLRVIDGGKGEGPAPCKLEAVADKSEAAEKNEVA